MTKYAYGRVSTIEQNLALQIDYFNKMGVLPSQQFTDKLSGKNTQRPGLIQLLDIIAEGDELYIYSLSRLGRSTKDLLDILEKLTKRGVKVVSCTEAIDTSTPAGRLIITVLAAVAQFERDTTIDRTLAGLQAAKDRGIKLGRPVVSTTQLQSAQELFNIGKSRKEVCVITKISIASLKRYLKDGTLREVAA